MITYLIANYNNGNYIGDCIDSLHTQTCSDWCCLIADDKSTDDSLAQIRPLLGPKVELIENAQNVGYVHTLIRLIDYAKTDIVGILDPDDALYPEATARVLQAYQANPETGLVYTQSYKYNEALTEILKKGFSSAIPNDSTSLVAGFVGALRTFRRSAYFNTSGLDPSMLYAEDRDLAYKLEEVTPFVFIDEPLYKHRQLPNSQSNAPEKRMIGIQNYRRAFKNALHRRNIRGLQKYIYIIYFRQQRSRHPIHSTKLGRFGKRIMQRLVMRLQ